MYNFSMRTRITKWGNSIGIRLPKVFAVTLGMDMNQEVDIECRNNEIIIRKPKENLHELVSQITDDNRHDGEVFDEPIGKEIW